MRPFKEVILFDNIENAQYDSGLKVTPTTNYVLKKTGVQILWRGSIDKFKKDFEIPEDAPIDTKSTGLDGTSANFVINWDWTTLNFKFNYQIWYRDSYNNSDNYYVNGLNHTINLTIPSVLVFNGYGASNSTLDYAFSPSGAKRVYNPNIFRLPVGINNFIISNKVSDFTSAAPSGSDRDIYLIFRYGVNGDDIQICLLTKDINGMLVNSQPLVMPYASLTFTGFNKIKRLK